MCGCVILQRFMAARWAEPGVELCYSSPSFLTSQLQIYRGAFIISSGAGHTHTHTHTHSDYYYASKASHTHTHTHTHTDTTAHTHLHTHTHIRSSASSTSVSLTFNVPSLSSFSVMMSEGTSSRTVSASSSHRASQHSHGKMMVSEPCHRRDLTLDIYM